MMQEHKLFMLILGCRPPGRNTEQHDVFFGIGNSLKDLLPQIKSFWPGAGTIHIDSWREVTVVNGHVIAVIPKQEEIKQDSKKLFFLNLGGYKPHDMEEYHYKILTVSKNKAEAVTTAKQSAFYLHTGFKGAPSHIDDKFGVDVDDIEEIKDVLPATIKEQFAIAIAATTDNSLPEDELHIGYLKLSSLQ
jgi:hypothetical protein